MIYNYFPYYCYPDLITNIVGGPTSYWIGLNDIDTSQGWQWTDGSVLVFFNWDQGM